MRTCQDYIGKEPKVYKKCNIVEIRHEPKGRKPTYQQNQGLKEWRTRPNSNQTISTSQNTTMGQVKKLKGARSPKMGAFGLSGVAAIPLVRTHPNRPLLAPFLAGSFPLTLQ